MFAGGEDPLYIARRLVRMAVGYRPCRSGGAASGERGEGCLRLPGVAGRGARAGPSDGLSRHGSEINAAYLAGLGQGREGKRIAPTAQAYSQCADEAHGSGRLRPWLRLRPQRGGRRFSSELFSRWHGAAFFYEPTGRGYEGRIESAAGPLGGDPGEQGALAGLFGACRRSGLPAPSPASQGRCPCVLDRGHEATLSSLSMISMTSGRSWEEPKNLRRVQGAGMAKADGATQHGGVAGKYLVSFSTIAS